MSLNITLPEDFKRFIDAEVAAGGHDGPGEYVQALLTQAMLKKNRVKVEALLDEALASGEATEMTADHWDEIWREVEERHAQRNGYKP